MSTGWQDAWPGEFNLWSYEYQAKKHNVILLRKWYYNEGAKKYININKIGISKLKIVQILVNLLINF